MTFDRIVLRLSGGGEAELLAWARQRGFRRFLVPSSFPARPDGVELFHEEATELWDSSRKQRWSKRSIEGPEDLEHARASLAGGASLLLRFPAERVLPLESLIALDPGAGDWMVDVGGLQELPAALGALEHGARGAVVTVRSTEEIRHAEAALDVPSIASLDWQLVEVTRVESGGTGDRVIVDTTSLLTPDEGLLVGSTARILIHVASEAEGSRFTRPRGFRVNAGAAHSYVLLADGTTRYLSELTAGDSVLIVAPRGNPRSARVGRLKIERRPLRLIEVMDSGGTSTLFAQEAETVRLSSEGARIPVTDLRPGTRIFAARLPAARHLGTVISESIDER